MKTIVVILLGSGLNMPESYQLPEIGQFFKALGKQVKKRKRNEL